jgi:histidyl-tRNA synthetase
MNKKEFKLNFKKLVEKRKLELKDINEYVANKIDTLSVPEEEKKNITKDLKAKALEFFKTENDNLKEIIRKLDDVPDGMSAEDYESLMTDMYVNTLDAIERNQNNMLALRLDYANHNCLIRESYYNSLKDNSTSNEMFIADLSGSSHKMFDPSAEGDGSSSI